MRRSTLFLLWLNDLVVQREMSGMDVENIGWEK